VRAIRSKPSVVCRQVYLLETSAVDILELDFKSQGKKRSAKKTRNEHLQAMFPIDGLICSQKCQSLHRRGTYTEAGGKQDERNRAQLQGASAFIRRGGHKMRDKRFNQNNLSKSSHMSCQPSFCSFLLPKPNFLFHLSFSAISPSAISQHAKIPFPMLPRKLNPRIFYVIPDQLLRSIHLSTVIPIRTLLKRPSSCHC
jgi:hypothetical protein